MFQVCWRCSAFPIHDWLVSNYNARVDKKGTPFWMWFRDQEREVTSVQYSSGDAGASHTIDTNYRLSDGPGQSEGPRCCPGPHFLWPAGACHSYNLFILCFRIGLQAVPARRLHQDLIPPWNFDISRAWDSWFGGRILLSWRFPLRDFLESYYGTPECNELCKAPSPKLFGKHGFKFFHCMYNNVNSLKRCQYFKF